MIFKIYIDSKKRYGCTKIRRALQKKGYPKISVNRVSRLMEQLNIRSIVVKKFICYKQKASHTCSCQNIINQNFAASNPNQMWLSDITYIHTIRHGWTYFASVLDVCTRKIVGFHFARKMDKQLVIAALEKACRNQGYPRGVVLHSDRGCQYTSTEYIATAARLGMKLSYSKKAAPLIMLLWSPFMRP